jgi:hypothetical protein
MARWLVHRISASLEGLDPLERSSTSLEALYPLERISATLEGLGPPSSEYQTLPRSRPPLDRRRCSSTPLDKSIKCPDLLRDAKVKGESPPTPCDWHSLGFCASIPRHCATEPHHCVADPGRCASTVWPYSDRPASLYGSVLLIPILLPRQAP